MKALEDKELYRLELIKTVLSFVKLLAFFNNQKFFLTLSDFCNFFSFFFTFSDFPDVEATLYNLFFKFKQLLKNCKKEKCTHQFVTKTL